jgi:hypothetical protein
MASKNALSSHTVMGAVMAAFARISPRRLSRRPTPLNRTNKGTMRTAVGSICVRSSRNPAVPRPRYRKRDRLYAPNTDAVMASAAAPLPTTTLFASHRPMG